MLRKKSQEEHQAQISPRFSVILCTYNRRNLVLSTLATLRSQTLAYNQFEVIVIDNGSSDGTLDAVRAYVSAGTQDIRPAEDTWRVQCLSEPQNGLADARNMGLQAASGEIAVFLDDDTLATPHFLERLLTAYEETGADAIGGRVELRWEARRPHWLIDELLETLGYYAPANVRTQLEEPAAFSSSNFSIKIEALGAIGSFSPLLSKRFNMPLRMEVYDVCRRLHSAGYALWYEPDAIVVHRVVAARLARAFFVGSAYWQGRSEVLAQHAASGLVTGQQFSPQGIPGIVRDIVYLALIHRPLLSLAGRPSNERLLAAMEQARKWGCVQQLWLLQRSLAGLKPVAVLLVHPAEPDAAVELLARSLATQDIDCATKIEDIALIWLWHHRPQPGRSSGILHFYRPGAFNLSYWQRQRLRFGLWLARRLKVRIVSTDTGGWWQQTRSLRFLSRRSLEHKLLYSSDIILTFTRQPGQLYPDKQLRRHVRCLPHPGFRGYYAPAVLRVQAHQQLGIPKEAGTVYLCFAHEHMEQEVVLLIEAFLELKKESALAPQLLLVGSPADKRISKRILKLAALNATIHLSTTTSCKENMPLYMGAANVLVLPHFAVQTAGNLGTACLGLSFERVVVAPNLPRFRGTLLPRASILYDPTDWSSLVRALDNAQRRKYHLNEKEIAALDAEHSWNQCAQRLLRIYQTLRQD
jgi:GT2 family glycosyltransferase